MINLNFISGRFMPVRRASKCFMQSGYQSVETHQRQDVFRTSPLSHSGLCSARPLQAGFTLLELMVTAGILAIVLVIALPSFQSVVNNARIASARDGLANAIKMTRSEAVFSKIPTTICASVDQQSCSGTGDWDNGWIIFNDADADGQIDNGDTLVDVFYGGGNVNIGAGSGGGIITFQASGMKTNVAVDNIGFCDPDAELDGKSLSVGNTGSLRYLGAATAGC